MKIIHVNKNVIQYNLKHGTSFPVCRVQDGNKTYYAESVDIKGPSKMVYKPDKPLSCGARLWIETDAEVELINKTDYKSIRKEMEKAKLT